MAPAITNWLSAFVANELKTAIDWSRENDSKDKQSPSTQDRFSDDGSNFHGRIDSTVLTAQHQLQLREVISLENGYCVVTISDGFTSMRARMNDGAMQLLELELESKVDQNTRGDVFSIQQATLVSTPYGLQQDLIVLHIDQIEYEYNLRKLLGAPCPIEQQVEIVTLLDQMLRVREMQLNQQSQHFMDEVPIKLEGDGYVRHSFVDSDLQSQTLPSESYASIPAKLHQPLQDDSSVAQFHTQVHQISSQAPFNRKRKGPNMDTDGLEIIKGVNVTGPLSRQDNGQLAPSPDRKRRNLHLQSLMFNNRPAMDKQVKTVPKTKDTPMPDAGEVEEILPSQINTNEQTPVQESVSGTVEIIDENIAKTPTPPTQPSASLVTPMMRYGRRAIPAKQKAILEKSSSWYPAMPGQTFPIPNVPVELIQSFKDAHISFSRVSNVVNITEEPAGSPVKTTLPASQQKGSSNPDEDEEYIPWEASSPPEQAAPQFPPDSSGVSPEQSDLVGRTFVVAISPAKAVHRGLQPAPAADLQSDSSTPVSSQERPSAEQPVETPQVVRHSTQEMIPRSAESAPKVAPIRSSAETSTQVIVQATPLSPHSTPPKNPRSNPIDPAILHRQRRTENFSHLSRLNWLRENYKTIKEPSTPPVPLDIPRAYRRAFPNDWVGATRITRDVNDAFPELSDPSCGWTIVPVRPSPQPPSTPSRGTPESRAGRQEDRDDGRNWSEHMGARGRSSRPPWKTRDWPSADSGSRFNSFAREYTRLKPGGFLHQQARGAAVSSSSSGNEVGYQTNVLGWITY